MKRTKFDQYSCDRDDEELFLIHSLRMYAATNDVQKRDKIIAGFTSNYSQHAYLCLSSYNAEMAKHYFNYWYEKRYGTKLLAETEEVEKETNDIPEKEKIDKQDIASWSIMGIIILIGIIITAIYGG